jgi:hypothetical protein
LKRSLVFHPLMLAAFPVVALYAYNAQELPLSALLVPLVVALAVASLLQLSTWLFCKSVNKAGIIVSLFLVLLLSTGYLFNLRAWLGASGPYIAGLLLVAIWVLLFPYLVYLIVRTRKTLRNPTIILNVATVLMVVVSLFTIGANEFRRLRSEQECMASDATVDLRVSEGQELPDIYYIILDRYAGAATLAETYSLPNGDFLDYLTGKGFYVASESSANYVRTSESLASSLNMEYIDYMDEKSNDLLPMSERIENNALQRSLKTAGYQFINVGSWWGPTRRNENADMNINYCTRTSEFDESLLTMTMPYYVSAAAGLVDDARMRQWKRTQFEFDELAEIPNMEEPTFTFAHILSPHVPYVFDSDGSFLLPEQANTRSDIESYRNQLVATNNMVKTLVDRLLKDSDVAPIIILQADEGPYPERYDAGVRAFNWGEATDGEIQQKFRILNAYYLPGVDYTETELSPSITPVNSFRLVFDLYFATNLGLLPDKSYAYVDYSHPYQFLDVTDKVRT